jgi:hypothetical protein
MQQYTPAGTEKQYETARRSAPGEIDFRVIFQLIIRSSFQEDLLG